MMPKSSRAPFVAVLLLAIFAHFSCDTTSTPPSGVGREPSSAPTTRNTDSTIKPSISLDCGGGIKMELIGIPAGTFTMGSNEGDDDEQPPHAVTISQPFYLGQYEVTQAQWMAVMGSNPSYRKGNRLPVESVSWDDCQEFCRKLAAKTGKTVRLPTEAEWEYACRAGSTGEFCFGDRDRDLLKHAWFVINSGNQTHPVGQKKPNAWGLHDMHGNVLEWCEDWYEKYPGSTARSDYFGRKYRVLRGGCWGGLPAYCRSARRYGATADFRWQYVSGFRVVVVASPAPAQPTPKSSPS